MSPTTAKPFRLGFFSYLSGGGSPAEIYRNVAELFGTAESLGLDSAWVAQHHFGSHGGLPSPFVFLSAVAARTSRIHLGTAVVTVPYENSLRVAEDAAVFETLYPGRLEVGLGSGFGSPAVDGLFGVDPALKRDLFNVGADRIVSAIRGEALDSAGNTLGPAVPALSGRLWEGPSKTLGVEEAARRGDGLLLSRVAIGAGLTPTPEVQIPFVERHAEILRADGIPPRVALSRTIFPARSRADAIAALRPGFESQIRHAIAQDPEVAEWTIEQHLAHNNVHYGSPDDIVESLSREPLLDRVTDVIFQVQPADPSQEETLAIIETVATRIAPRLGWTPAL